jgi:hypothetical protein
MIENRVLNNDMPDVVVIQGEIGHLEPERENTDADGDEKRLLEALSIPPHKLPLYFRVGCRKGDLMTSYRALGRLYP